MFKSLIANFLSFIVALIILFVYQININNVTIENIINSIMSNLILLSFILLISILSQYYYDNDSSYKE